MSEANLGLNPAGQTLSQAYAHIASASTHFAKMGYDLNAGGVDKGVMTNHLRADRGIRRAAGRGARRFCVREVCSARLAFLEAKQPNTVKNDLRAFYRR